MNELRKERRKEQRSNVDHCGQERKLLEENIEITKKHPLWSERKNGQKE